MGRHVRHIHARPNEWVRVHRGEGGSGGGGGGSGGGSGGEWGIFILYGAGIFLAYILVMRIFEFIAEHWVIIISVIGAGVTGCVTAWIIWAFRQEIWAKLRLFGQWMHRTSLQAHQRYLKWRRARQTTH